MEQITLKDVLKFVTITIGALSVMTFGLLVMPMWHVGNWDSGIQVPLVATTKCVYHLP